MHPVATFPYPCVHLTCHVVTVISVRLVTIAHLLRPVHQPHSSSSMNGRGFFFVRLTLTQIMFAGKLFSALQSHSHGGFFGVLEDVFQLTTVIKSLFNEVTVAFQLFRHTYRNFHAISYTR